MFSRRKRIDRHSLNVLRRRTKFKIADQDKIVGYAGHNVTITGKSKGNTISLVGVSASSLYP